MRRVGMAVRENPAAIAGRDVAMTAMLKILQAGMGRLQAETQHGHHAQHGDKPRPENRL